MLFKKLDCFASNIDELKKNVQELEKNLEMEQFVHKAMQVEMNDSET